MATGRSLIRNLPYPLESDAPDVAADIEQLTTALDLGSFPILTTLPGSPTDGQEIRFLADSANGVVWHLRYRSASASAYKWEFVGGSALQSEVAASETTTSGTFAGLTTAGPSITLPTGGDFDVEIGALVVTPGSTGTAAMSYKIGAAAADPNDQVQMGYVSGEPSASVFRSRRKTGLASATVLLAQYNTTTGTATFSNRYMRVIPVRVG